MCKYFILEKHCFRTYEDVSFKTHLIQKLKNHVFSLDSIGKLVLKKHFNFKLDLFYISATVKY